MATFPALEPATRSYDLGLFPLTEEPTISAGIVRFRHSNRPENYQLAISYNALTDAEASLIREHYQFQGGGYRSFQLPPIVWAGHTFSGNVVPYNTRWRYTETPEEEHFSAGLVNVTVTLGSDGTIDAELGLRPVSITFATGGVGIGSSGLATTVTCTLAAGAATGA